MGHRPHNFLATGEIAPMESASMAQAITVVTAEHCLRHGDMFWFLEMMVIYRY